MKKISRTNDLAFKKAFGSDGNYIPSESLSTCLFLNIKLLLHLNLLFIILI